MSRSQLAGNSAVDVSPDERFLAVGYMNGVIRLFSFPSGQLQTTFTNHKNIVFAVLYSPDGCVLSSASADGSARFWDVSTQREIAVLRGHLDCVYGAALSPDGRRLATGGGSPADAVKLWDLVAHRELLSLLGEGQHFINLTFSPDGNILVATSLDGLANFWRAPSWGEIAVAEKQNPALLFPVSSSGK